MFRLLSVTIIRLIQDYKNKETIQLEHFPDISDLKNVLCKVYNIQGMYIRKD